jgi:hypothetical protein
MAKAKSLEGVIFGIRGGIEMGWGFKISIFVPTRRFSRWRNCHKLMRRRLLTL